MGLREFEIIESLGGADDVVPEKGEITSCDKLHHFARSVAHQINHLKIARGILGPQLETPLTGEHGRIISQSLGDYLSINRSRKQK